MHQGLRRKSKREIANCCKAKGALHYVYTRHDQVQETLDHCLIKSLLKGWSARPRRPCGFNGFCSVTTNLSSSFWFHCLGIKPAKDKHSVLKYLLWFEEVKQIFIASTAASFQSTASPMSCCALPTWLFRRFFKALSPWHHVISQHLWKGTLVQLAHIMQKGGSKKKFSRLCCKETRRTIRRMGSRRTIRKMKRRSWRTEERKKERGRAGGPCREVLGKSKVREEDVGKVG